ncbi:glycosyltransferase family 2 protein [Henriciella sp. AS95]|uniref:glycosyltransferase family 2 protein n=1 Tax=Henriciella sp. AS95 TaxID=3135782 RepID=UPI00317127E2
MHPPSVSIIMPAYNCERTIAASIRSVTDQTFEDWELIIIDDGSSDDTLILADSFSLLDCRIRVMRQQNAGPSAARNYGISLASAPVVAFLDSDDLWAPERLQGLLDRFSREPDTGVLFTRVRFIDDVSDLPGRISDHVPELDAERLLGENPVCTTSNIACRAEVLCDVGLFSHGLNFAEDQEWLLRVAMDGRWAIRGIDKEWLFYRSSAESQSADLDAMRRGWLTMIERATQHGTGPSRQAIRRAHGPFYRYLARRALRMRSPFQSIGYLAQGLVADPGLLLREPRRTVLTGLGAFLSFLPSNTIRGFVEK